MAESGPTFKAPGKQGDIIFGALVKLAALIVLLLLGGIIISLLFSSRPALRNSVSLSCGIKSGMPRMKTLARWCPSTAPS